MSCTVCNGEERYLFADFGAEMLMGYVAKPTDDKKYPYLDLYLVGKDGDSESFQHRQILAHCPLCGEQLCDIPTKKEMIAFYDKLHENRAELRNAIAHETENPND